MTMITCTNKGCYKASTSSLLDEKSNEVICSECGKPVAVTDFMKNSMRSSGQVLKSQANSSFSVECQKCHKRGQPSLDAKDNAICYNCGSVMLVTHQFKVVLRDYLGKKVKEEKESDPDAA